MGTFESIGKPATFWAIASICCYPDFLANLISGMWDHFVRCANTQCKDNLYITCRDIIVFASLFHGFFTFSNRKPQYPYDTLFLNM